MAKIQVEDKKYDCSEKIDGTLVYYYFNPPQLLEADDKKFSGAFKILGGIILIALAFFAKLQIAFVTPPYFIGLGILLILVGIFSIKKGKDLEVELESKMVSDEEYDAMEAIMLEDVKERGMRILNLDEDEIKEADPLILHRYGFDGDEKKGADGKYRSTEHISTVFYFTSDSLFVYKYTFSMKHKVTTEETMTLFYSDIVSVLVGAVDAQVGEEETIGIRQLTISSVGGQTVSYQFISSEETNISINAMQSLFRSKKKIQ